jgi:hypothetical protein
VNSVAGKSTSALDIAVRLRCGREVVGAKAAKKKANDAKTKAPETATQKETGVTFVKKKADRI